MGRISSKPLSSGSGQGHGGVLFCKRTFRSAAAGALSPPQARKLLGFLTHFYTICTHFPHLISGIFRHRAARRGQPKSKSAYSKRRVSQHGDTRASAHIYKQRCAARHKARSPHTALEPPTCQPPYGTAATPGRSCCQDASPAPRSLALPLMRHSQSASARQCTCELRSSPRGKHT
jgi:hypothetical protein